MSIGIATTRAHARYTRLLGHMQPITGWFTANEAARAVQHEWPRDPRGYGWEWNHGHIRVVLHAAFTRGECEKRVNPDDGRSVQYRWMQPALTWV